MSSDLLPNLETPFQRVTRKNRRSKSKYKSRIPEFTESLTEYEKLRAISRIHQAKEEILTSYFYESISAELQKGLDLLDKISVSEIICLGLGRVGECLAPKYQLAILLCLSDTHKIDVKIFDPIFSEDDRFILDKFNVEVLSENLEGKYLASQNGTIFFLPHCPKKLTNNILWKNWGLNLSNCILICNSFESIVEQNTQMTLQTGANYILNIASHAVELVIENNFKFPDIFNDTSIHIFPHQKLTALPNDFWELATEAENSDEDIEIVRRIE